MNINVNITEFPELWFLLLRLSDACGPQAVAWTSVNRAIVFQTSCSFKILSLNTKGRDMKPLLYWFQVWQMFIFRSKPSANQIYFYCLFQADLYLKCAPIESNIVQGSNRNKSNLPLEICNFVTEEQRQAFLLNQKQICNLAVNSLFLFSSAVGGRISQYIKEWLSMHHVSLQICTKLNY